MCLRVIVCMNVHITWALRYAWGTLIYGHPSISPMCDAKITGIDLMLQQLPRFVLMLGDEVWLMVCVPVHPRCWMWLRYGLFAGQSRFPDQKQRTISLWTSFCAGVSTYFWPYSVRVCLCCCSPVFIQCAVYMQNVLVNICVFAWMPTWGLYHEVSFIPDKIPDSADNFYDHIPSLQPKITWGNFVMISDNKSTYCCLLLGKSIDILLISSLNYEWNISDCPSFCCRCCPAHASRRFLCPGTLYRLQDCSTWRKPRIIVILAYRSIKITWEVTVGQLTTVFLLQMWCIPL